MSNQSVVIQQAPSASGLAIAGLIFSIMGWFTCGLLCIPGAFFCLLALFSPGPKGTAIAGLIVGFPGTLFFGFVGLGIITGLLGIGATTTGVAEAERARVAAEMRAQQETMDTIQLTDVEQQPESEALPKLPSASPAKARPSVPEHSMPKEASEVTDRGQTPDEIEAARWRTWTTADGKYKVHARFVTFTAGTVTLERADGSTVDVKVYILCSEDQEFVKQRKWSKPGQQY